MQVSHIKLGASWSLGRSSVGYLIFHDVLLGIFPLSINVYVIWLCKVFIATFYNSQELCFKASFRTLNLGSKLLYMCWINGFKTWAKWTDSRIWTLVWKWVPFADLPQWIFYFYFLHFRVFPNCKFADKCLFIHPNCKYDAKCTKPDCPYTHASRRTPLPPPKPGKDLLKWMW